MLPAVANNVTTDVASTYNFNNMIKYSGAAWRDLHHAYSWFRLVEMWMMRLTQDPEH